MKFQLVEADNGQYDVRCVRCDSWYVAVWPCSAANRTHEPQDALEVRCQQCGRQDVVFTADAEEAEFEPADLIAV